MISVRVAASSVMISSSRRLLPAVGAVLQVGLEGGLVQASCLAFLVAVAAHGESSSSVRMARRRSFAWKTWAFTVPSRISSISAISFWGKPSTA